jgi:dTDP-4-amino-4,6-dideoxygalactose transaminase
MRFLEEFKHDFDGIIVTNVFGMQVEIVEYERWCECCGKLLIFDNAASPLGFIEDGRSIHDVGDGAIISLHETKPFGRGEGGAIIVSREVAPFVHQAMNFGYDIPNQVRVPNRQASNWRMSDFAAAAICDHFDTMINQKWEERLQEMTQIAVQQLERCGKRLAWPIRYPTVLGCLFVRLVDGSNGDATCQRLNSHGIEAKQYYTPLASRSEVPNAWNLFDTTVCLPFHLDISTEDLINMIMLV